MYLKCCSAAITEAQEASTRFPSCERTWTSARIDHTDCPATRHKDSVSRASDRRIVFSSSRESRASVEEGREASKEGSGMGEREVVMVKRPSKGRSGSGRVTSAVMCVRTLSIHQYIVAIIM